MKKETKRDTKETQIELALECPGAEKSIETGCGFLDHMLDLLCHRAGLGLELKAHGDTNVDYHHLVEDVGITLGQTLLSVVKELGPIKRYGWCLLPMDGSLARVALDFSGRGGLYWSGDFPSQKCGDFDNELVPEFFAALARESRMTLHIAILTADNSHHAAEAVFKGVGMAIAQALEPAKNAPSTKGLWL